jgi:hypothetical protein
MERRKFCCLALEINPENGLQQQRHDDGANDRRRVGNGAGERRESELLGPDIRQSSQRLTCRAEGRDIDR